MAVATYCYFEKVRRTMRTAIASYLLQLKFDTETNSNIHNSIVIFVFSVFDKKYPF